MGDMSDIYKSMSEYKKKIRSNNLNDFDLKDWIKIRDYSFRKVVDNKKFTYYPSSKCLVLGTHSYRGIHKNKLNEKVIKLSNNLL